MSDYRNSLAIYIRRKAPLVLICRHSGGKKRTGFRPSPE
jgi:hypothetical protein